MGSYKTHIAVILFIFSCSFISISAQSGIQSSYSRVLPEVKKEANTTRSVQLLITGKNLQPISSAKVSVVAYDLHWETDPKGWVDIVIPGDLNLEKIELQITARKYFRKNIWVSFVEEQEISRTVHLKYNIRSGCFTSIGTPSF